MSKGTVLIGIILLGIVALAVINVTQHVQNGNELDYYLLEETTEAAMIDAVDLAYYQNTGGIIRMDREKFCESFLRRFAENINSARDYDIKIFDLNETPPKVSIQIDAGTVATFTALRGEDAGVTQSARITNKIDAILETKYIEDRLLGEVTSDN